MEEWRPIPGFDGYEVSDLGRVRSVDREVVQISPWGGLIRRRIKGVLLKPGRHPDGHLIVNLSNRIAGTKFVHKLVLLTFIGPRPRGLQARHFDGNPANNRLDNLRYGTPKDNSEDAFRHGTRIRGERQGRARLTEKDVRDIRASNLMGVTLAKMYGVSPTQICNVRNGKAWSWLNG